MSLDVIGEVARYEIWDNYNTRLLCFFYGYKDHDNGKMTQNVVTAPMGWPTLYATQTFYQILIWYLGYTDGYIASLCMCNSWTFYKGDV